MADDSKSSLVGRIRDTGYDVGVIDDGSGNPISPQHDYDTSRGAIKEGSDLSKKTRRTIGQYLNAATQVNHFHVADNITEISTTSVDGSPAPLSQNPNAGLTFAPNAPSAYSDAFAADFAGTTAGSLSSVLSKGKSKGVHPTTDGNNLLSEPANISIANDKYVSAVIKRNRFIPGIAALVERQHAPDLRNQSDVDADLGYYSRKKLDTNSTAVDINYANKSIAADDMGKVGQTLMLRATGQLNANSRGFNPKTNVAAALVPGSTQLLPTQIINSRDLEARDVLEALIGEEIGSHAPGPDVKSWGVLNNQLAPFTGVLPTGMIALCIALILALQLSFEALNIIMKLVTDVPRTKTDLKIGTYFKGKSSEPVNSSAGSLGGLTIAGATDLHSLLGLINIENEHSYNDCFKKGMDIFFGVQANTTPGILGNVASAAGSAFKKALSEPGFYTVFCRSIIRSGYGIGKKLSSLGGNPLSIVQGAANVIQDLRSSKIIAAYNMFAQIGDAEFRRIANEKTHYNMDGNDDGAPAVYKSRYKGSTALAWRNDAAPSMYILPMKTVESLRAVGIKNPYWAPSMNILPGATRARRGTNLYINKNLTANIPANFAKAMENALEAEYVPFYFQDLRTNEIIAFHAFLASLNESYAVNWENTEAYGRIDPVRIYKNTNRSIDLSFHVAALNKNDFDAMWFKINKLLTLIYPQWSKGKQLTIADDNLNFTQPFSQLISSSPLIRLRIGDLIRSNYSKFNLARLFNVSDSAEAKDIKTKLNDSIQPLMKAVFNYNYYTSACTPEELALIKDAVNNRTCEATVNANQSIIRDPANTEAAGLGGLSALVGVNSKKSAKAAYLYTQYKIGKIKDISSAGVIVELSEPDAQQVIGTKTIGFPYSGMSVNIVNAEKYTDNAPPFNQAAANFLDPKNNPIVKYFEENTGRGLACTINSLNMSWVENNTWETDAPGSKAPKSCVISMQLTPIHDIAPGIDHDGFNRAPIYRVGKQIEAITNPDEFAEFKKPTVVAGAAAGEAAGAAALVSSAKAALGIG